MTAEKVIKQLDLMRIALGLETRATRAARVERVVKDAGLQMHRYGDGLMVRLKNGRRAFVEPEAFR